jgi:DNA-binding NarL/FixJ family response regulator
MLMHRDEERHDSTPPSTPSRIVVVDDHPLYRSAIRQMLEGQSGLEIVGETTDGLHALEICRRLRPALVLMDLMMPRMDGLAATREIKRELPDTIVLILTASEDQDHLAKAFKAGAGGYVLKDASATQIIGAIRKALEGEHFFDQKVATRLLAYLMDQVSEEKLARSIPAERSESGPLKVLTPRELDVLRLMVQGHTNQQIARSLLLSVGTVKKHVRSILTKLGVSDRVQAVVCYLEAGAPTVPNSAIPSRTHLL